LQLTAYIVRAADGQLVVGVVELPALTATSRSLDEIVDEVKEQAAQLTGRPPGDFDVHLPF
jgi:predicted RNase H-like HicB family nuclease